MPINPLSPQMIALIGVVGFALLVFQMLVGYRKVRFKGAKHMKVHKTVAWVIMGITLIHGTLGLIWVLRLTLG